MKAARFYGPGDIRIDDVPEPATRPGTVKVEVEWCGICGTDLHEYLDGPIFAPTAEAPHPLTGESMPITLGHEFAGVVAEVGEGVARVRGRGPGGRRAVHHLRSLRRLPIRSLQRLPDSRVRRAVRVRRRLLAVRRRRASAGSTRSGALGTDVGALIEPLAVAYHAVKLSKAQPGHTALVFGGGSDRPGHHRRAQGGRCRAGAGRRARRRTQAEGARRRGRPRARPDQPPTSPPRSRSSPTAGAPTSPSSARASTRC